MSRILDNDITLSSDTRALYDLDLSADSDFLGFSYNGVHSNTLGIIRVSDGSRYNENLLPTMQDKTVQITGGDGTYYFGSYYTQKQFSLSFAFDNISEEKLRQIKQLFSDKGIHDLVFDELPYKIWKCKVTGTPQIKYICFDKTVNNTTVRVYKGEGTLAFTCYETLARVPYNKKFLADYNNTNKPQWVAASKLLQNYNSNIYNVTVDSLIDVDPQTPRNDQKQMYIYNGGDETTPWKLKIAFKQGTTAGAAFTIPKITINYTYQGKTNTMIFNGVSRGVNNNRDTYVLFDSNTRLAEGFSESQGVTTKTGTIYNGLISGDFFNLPATPQTNSATPPTSDLGIFKITMENMAVGTTITDYLICESGMNNRPLIYDYKVF